MPRIPRVRARLATSRPSIDRGTLSGAECTWISIAPCSMRAAAEESGDCAAMSGHERIDATPPMRRAMRQDAGISRRDVTPTSSPYLTRVAASLYLANQTSENMADKWELTGTVLVACNCDWGCPCNFNARPTAGKCEGGWTWHV